MLALLGLAVAARPSFISADAYTFNLNCSLIVLIVKHCLEVSSTKIEGPCCRPWLPQMVSEEPQLSMD